MADEDAEKTSADPGYCRNCGAPKRVVMSIHPATLQATPSESGADWLCAECEHWQDSMLCPTCSQPVRISLMPAELAPKAAKPKKA